MKKSKILNVLFWITLIIGIILLLWLIFGNSPTELGVILTFILALLFKMWTISDDLNGFKHEVKLSFMKVKSDFDSVKKDIGGLKNIVGARK